MPAQQTARKARRQYEFDGWATPPPSGEWAYVLDDHGITFGPSWWPYYRSSGERCAIRAAPDSEYQSWRNEYVLIFLETDATATAYLHLWLRRRGTGGMVARSKATLDLRERTATVDPGCPKAVAAQAHEKAQKLLALLVAGRRERRIGWERPWTAYDSYLRSIARRAAGSDARAGDPIRELTLTGVIVPDLAAALEERRQQAMASDTITGVDNASLLTLQSNVARAGAAMHPGWTR